MEEEEVERKKEEEREINIGRGDEGKKEEE